MTESVRPKRVVIVDADNPLEEVRGEFFWREDHERIVENERRTAYEQGMRDALRASPPRRVTYRVRRRFGWRLKIGLLLIASAYLVSLVVSILR